MCKGRSNGKRAERDTAKEKRKLEISPLSLLGQHFRQTLRSSGLGLVVECFRCRPSFFRTPSGGYGSPHKPALRFSSLLGWLARLQESPLDSLPSPLLVHNCSEVSMHRSWALLPRQLYSLHSVPILVRVHTLVILDWSC